MTRADRLLVLVLALASLAAWPIALAVGAGSGDIVTISGPAGVSTISLQQDSILAVEGLRGPLTVEVLDGEVFVTEADCPDGVCVKTGHVSRPGAVVACVPNGVLVQVGGGQPGEFDARIR